MPRSMTPAARCALAATLLALAFACAPAKAQGGDRHAEDEAASNTSLTLSQALDAAWARHPQAAALTARLAESQARLDRAGNLTPAPAAVSVGHKTDRLHGDAGQREWEVELATPVWLPGQRGAREMEARQAQQALDARTAHMRWQLAGEVREAWWGVAAAREARKLAGQRQETAQALAANVQRRFKAGELARVDANLAETEHLAAQTEVLAADQHVRQAEQALQALTGLPAPAALPGEASLEAPALEDHPRLQNLRAHGALAHSRIALVDASRRDAPEVALSWARERGDALRAYDRTVGVKVTWPLSSSSRVRQDSAAARADVAEAEAEWALARSAVEQAATLAQAAMQASRQQLSMAMERQRLAADTLQLAQRSFDLGESDLPALMRARADAREAEASLHSQQVARELALSRHHQALGLLP
jgi:cobalt-zinc-cadmium efflux system outer membrane protein